MKKYLLLIENEDLWEKFKKCIDADINTEIISLIEKKIKTATLSVKTLGRNNNGK
jgi:hypothetical protein